MIQFNLLPDVKQEYIKAQRLKRLVIGVSFVLSAAALTLFVILMSTVYLVQRKVISGLNQDIATTSAQLKDSAHIADILTVQGQLGSLSSLHGQKPAATRLFGFLAQLVPTQATVSDLKVDYTANTMTISGNAPGLDVVNTFADALKYTTYTAKGSDNSAKAFPAVVLSSFSRSESEATYTITLNFDATIFNNADDITLNVGGQGQPLPLQPSIIFKKSE